MININYTLAPQKLLSKINSLFEHSAEKILSIQKSWDPADGTPVYTVKGKYTSKGWTEWTQGFQFGSAILQYDAMKDSAFLTLGRDSTVKYMASHVSHTGVHDHGFNNISTYGNLLRLMNEGRIEENEWERNFYELAIKISGAVQASRWTKIHGNLGYIYSFNGPHSLFCDTMRSLRALACSHQLGHVLMAEKDEKVNLLERLIKHAYATAQFNVYFGHDRDSFDLRGRVAHESVFNTNDGSYRCPSSQQGYSPFSTWTRGLSWVLAGFPEQIEFIKSRSKNEFTALQNCPAQSKKEILIRFLETAEAVADFYIEQTPADGIPYWDTGAPGLSKIPDYLDSPADPFNSYEPVDSSAAAISAQGLLRLGKYHHENGSKEKGDKYFQAGLTIADTLFQAPYISEDPDHQGLILHSVYHRPNGWDYIHSGQSVPNGESSMWGDYHARELALYLKRLARNRPYYTFFG